MSELINYEICDIGEIGMFEKENYLLKCGMPGI